MNASFSFELEHRRHYECGRLYYIEKSGPNSRCPYCAPKSDAEAQREREKHAASAARMSRVIRGLRGALKKAKATP